MTTLFISHASADRDLALKLKAVLEHALGSTTIFCSSDVAAIPGGSEWLQEIMNNLRRAKACVVLMSPEAVHYSPWVTYEAGGAYLRFVEDPAKSRLFPACAHGVTAGALPAPFQSLQARRLDRLAEVEQLCRDVAKCLGRRARLSRALARELVASAERGAADWTFVVPAVVAQRSDNSPFNFESFLGRAGDTVEDVFVAGFNLHYVATTQQCEDLAMAFLRKTPRRVIRILLSDPAKASQFRVWERVGDTYLTDLTKAVARFKEWRKRAKREGVLDRLEIKQTTFVPHSLTAIDPESAEAVLALTPAVLKKPLSAERPQLVLSRRHQPAVFSYYWDSYKDLFRRGSPLALKYGDKVSTASRPPRRP